MLVPDLPATLLVSLIAIAFVAGLARGFSGFGAALIFVPVASALIGPKVAVPLLLVVDFIAALGMIPDAWRKSDRRDVAIMALGGLIGVPIGVYVLTIAEPVALRWMIVILVLALLLLIMSGWRYRRVPTPPVTVGVGMTSGFLSGAAQIGGPPVVAYLLGRAMDHHSVRANIVLYFALQSVFSAVSYVAGGLITREVLMLAVIVTPVFACAIWLGSHMFSRTDERFFRRVCYGLIAAAAFAGLPSWG